MYLLIQNTINTIDINATNTIETTSTTNNKKSRSKKKSTQLITTNNSIDSEIIISNSNTKEADKIEIFVAIFQLLKNYSSTITMTFTEDTLHIQSIDKSQICIADIVFSSKWFSNYECITPCKITVDSIQYATLMTHALKHSSIEIKYNIDDEPDKMFINLLKNINNENDELKSSFDYLYELNLMDVETNKIDIPDIDYNVDFSMNTKQLTETLSGLSILGSSLNILCNEETIKLIANDISTKLTVNINIDDLLEYSICENLELSVSLTHLSKMCLSTKINQCVQISLSSELPMRITYVLDSHTNINSNSNTNSNSTINSKVVFYVAPKIID